MNAQPVNFDDLDDLDTELKRPAVLAAAQAKIAPAAQLGMGVAKSVATIARFPCSKCKGSGRFISYAHRDCGPCNQCKGSGKQKTDPRIAKERAAQRSREALAWREAHSAEVAWINAKAPTFGVAASMKADLAQYGSLSDGRMAAVQRFIQQDKDRAVACAERKPDVDVAGAGFDRMLKAFVAAKSSGLKRPKFHVAKLVFSLAKEDSANAGCLYVKSDGVYIGKITAAGGFFAGRDCNADDKAEVTRVGADPLGAAVMHGRQTGSCSCCGRELENAESVALGIGPICRRKWGL
jgi:hypothetical protein